MTHPERPTVIAARAVLDALVEVYALARQGEDTEMLTALWTVIDAANSTLACAKEDAEAEELHKKYYVMIEVAKKYYRALDAADTTTPEKVDKLADELEVLIEPFSDHPAFVAFLQMKRCAAGVVRESEKND